ncbi:MAG: GTP cyclohydrolase MptA [Methanomethylophilus sp.]|jgi:GTP cyclohydrolase-4
MALKCDVQYSRGSTGFKLTKVGVSGVRKPVLIARPGINNPLSKVVNCSFDIYVDLPAAQRGSHLSRNVEVLRAVAEESVQQPVDGLENLAADMVRKLLVKHEYAQNAYVSIEAEYFRPRKTPSGRDTLESYTLIAGARATRDGEVRKTIGCKAIGMTACPCAQETVGELLKVEDPGFPMMSHNQRNVCSIVLTTGEDESIEADDLIDLAEKAVSSPTFELLKREDEGRVVINAHENTRFVEDVVRNGLTLVVEKYKDLKEDTEVLVSSDSEESIHKHNAYAERTATLGELREEYEQKVLMV